MWTGLNSPSLASSSSSSQYRVVAGVIALRPNSAGLEGMVVTTPNMNLENSRNDCCLESS